MGQIHALSTPECQEGEHGVRFKGNINKESFKSLRSQREDMNESKSPMSQRNVLKESL